MHIVTYTRVASLSALDLAKVMAEEGGNAYLVELRGHAESVQILHFHGLDRAGVAWGADAIWTDVDPGATPEQIVEQVLCRGDVRN